MPDDSLREELARVTAERDALRVENAALEDDLAHMLDVRNRVLQIAAGEVHPGPDGQDDLDRERLIQRWLDEARDEEEWSRPLVAQAQHRAVLAEAENAALREALRDPFPTGAHQRWLRDGDDEAAAAISAWHDRRRAALASPVQEECVTDRIVLALPGSDMLRAYVPVPDRDHLVDSEGRVYRITEVEPVQDAGGATVVHLAGATVVHLAASPVQEESEHG